MRICNVVLILGLLCLASASHFEFTNLLEVKELQKTSYGSSLVQTISLALQSSGGKIEEVQKLLEDLEFKLNKDQEAADKDWEKESARLDAKIAELKERIEALRVEIAQLEQEISALKEKIHQAELNIAQYKEQKAENDKTIEELAENRRKDEEEYAKSIQEHDDLVNAIGQVIDELTKLKGHVSGHGRPVHVDEIDQEARDREWETSQQLEQSFIQLGKSKEEAYALAQVAIKADQGSLEKLISLLQTLLDSTKASRNADEQHEEESKESNHSLFERLTQDNHDLGELITSQEANLAQYKEEKEQKEQKKREDEEEKSAKETELVATIEERRIKQQQYEDDKKAREQELTVIRRLKKIVEERLHHMSQFLTSQVN
jgi:hypothetical protein